MGMSWPIINGAWWSIPRMLSPWPCPCGQYIPIGITSLYHCVPCPKCPTDVMSPNYVSLFHGQGVPDFVSTMVHNVPVFFRYCMTTENMLSVGNRDVWWKNQKLTLYRCSKSCSDSAENISIASLIYLKNMFNSLILISVSGAHISLNCSIISLIYSFMIWNLTKILEKTWKCTVRTKFQSNFSIIFPCQL
jgi:hypothetical protein